LLTILSSNHKAKIHYLEGLNYVGSLKNHDLNEGAIYFELKNTLQITGKCRPEPDYPYETRIQYSNGDFYEGYLINGKYEGRAVYGNKN